MCSISGEAVFFGETAINLDAKGRLAMPMRYRDAIQERCNGRLVLTYSAFDSGALYLYPEEEWERVRDEVTSVEYVQSRTPELAKETGGECQRS